jgi:Putative zinc-finger
MAQLREFAMTQRFENKSCEEISQLLPDYLHGRLQPEEMNMVKVHLEGCGACAEEVALWQKLGALPPEQPSPVLATRFNAMLETYQEGRWEHRNLQSERNKFLDFGAVMAWLRTPALSVGWAVALLLAGFFGGRYLERDTKQTSQLAAVQQELVNMQSLVVVSMLKQQSPSERLQGVSFSMDQKQPDGKVLEALLHTLRYDNSVDVRLAALDALSRYSSRPDIRKGLKDSLQPQQSPMVQIALIDTLVDLQDSSIVPQLKQFQSDPKTDPTVRKRADLGIQQLS